MNLKLGLVVAVSVFSMNAMADGIALSCENRESHDVRGDMMLDGEATFLEIDNETLTVSGDQQAGRLTLRNLEGNRTATVSQGDINSLVGQQTTSVIVTYGYEELKCQIRMD